MLLHIHPPRTSTVVLRRTSMKSHVGFPKALISLFRLYPMLSSVETRNGVLSTVLTYLSMAFRMVIPMALTRQALPHMRFHPIPTVLRQDTTLQPLGTPLVPAPAPQQLILYAPRCPTLALQEHMSYTWPIRQLLPMVFQETVLPSTVNSLVHSSRRIGKLVSICRITLH